MLSGKLENAGVKCSENLTSVGDRWYEIHNEKIFMNLNNGVSIVANTKQYQILVTGGLDYIRKVAPRIAKQFDHERCLTCKNQKMFISILLGLAKIEHSEEEMNSTWNGFLC
jgi:hypothetical protein